MAGLCEGGNEPAGSLKASNKVIRPATTGHTEHQRKVMAPFLEIVSERDSQHNVRSSVDRQKRCLPCHLNARLSCGRKRVRAWS
ncbi:hypothetical protein ANN_07310 [Periplaneta americana]|uniref:Uncharacterized protein n=1 Tax=Periplaneta americana TaxID=6978 RepID=A0ABQ8SYX7_PERAM|nr:hypothetical protein ANN_07310 [Periplaneta americana]